LTLTIIRQRHLFTVWPLSPRILKCNSFKNAQEFTSYYTYFLPQSLFAKAAACSSFHWPRRPSCSCWPQLTLACRMRYSWIIIQIFYFNPKIRCFCFWSYIRNFCSIWPTSEYLTPQVSTSMGWTKLISDSHNGCCGCILVRSLIADTLLVRIQQCTFHVVLICC
jgi:hypothetical protein